MLRTRPLGADVFIDGRKAGKTPFEYTDRKWFFGETHLKINKEGYLPLHTVVKRKEKIDWGALLGIISIPWAGKYQTDYIFHLKSEKN